MPFVSGLIELRSNKPQFKPCCEYGGKFDNFDFKELQDQFLKNEKPKLCNKCWYNEDNGFKSQRQKFNDMYDTSATRIYNLSFLVTSTCNYKCVMCM